MRLTPPTLVIVPPGRAMTVAATEHPTAPRNAGKHNNGGFTPGSSQLHTVGDGERALVLACKSFRADYGPALDSFASLAMPFVETFRDGRAPVRAAHRQEPVGLSRSAFKARFFAAFREPPMSLLRRVRMRHAADLLTANALSIDQVALNAT